MQQVIELEQQGFTFSSVGGKLKYQYKGEGLPDKSVALLLNEIKSKKQEAIQYLEDRKMDARDAIQSAWDGILKQPVKIQPIPEYQDLWHGPVWLCPNDRLKQQVRGKYPADFILSASEFFNICEVVVERGQAAAVPVVEAMRVFGGSLQK